MESQIPDERMNVVFEISHNLDDLPEDFSPPSIWGNFRFSDGYGSFLKQGANRVVAFVSFLLEKGHHAEARVVDIFSERQVALNPNLRTLVVCAAGKKTWRGASGGVEQFGCVGDHYGSLVILPPGVMPASHGQPEATAEGGIVIGSWARWLTVWEGRHTVYQVVTVPSDITIARPEWVPIRVPEAIPA